MQGTGFPIPQAKRKHPGHTFERSPHAPTRNSGKKYLGVGMTAPLRGPATDFELPAEVEVVVDLAVKGEDVPARVRKHWLMAGWRQVQDRQPAVPKADTCSLVDPDPGIVGSAMAQAG